jgi:hypothetical protein
MQPWARLLRPPAARHGHSVVWTGTEFIIRCGVGTGGYRNDGGRYQKP